MSHLVPARQHKNPAVGELFGEGIFAGYISHAANGGPTHALIVVPSGVEYEYFDGSCLEGVVTLTDPPEYNPATHRLEQRPPAKADGVLTQQWELVELDTEGSGGDSRALLGMTP